MPVIQRDFEAGDFHVANDAPFLDEDLSWEAKGVLGYLFSKPEDWTPRIYDIVESGPCKQHKIKTVFSELEDAGYMKREKFRKDDGTFDWKVTVSDHPRFDPGWTQSTPDDVHPGRDRGYSNTDRQSKLNNTKTEEQSSGSSAHAGARVDGVWDFLPEQHQDVSADVKEAYHEYKEGRVDLPMLARRYLTRNGSSAPTNTIAQHADEHPTPKVVAAYVVAGIKADRNPTSYASTILDQDWTRTDDGQTDGSFADQYAKHRAAARRGAGLDG